MERSVVSARVTKWIALASVMASVFSVSGLQVRAASNGNSDGQGENPTGGIAAPGRIYATAALDGGVVTVVRGASGSAPRGPVCSWTRSLFNAFDTNVADIPVEIVESGTDGWYYDPANDTYVTEAGPGIETLYWVDCPNGVGRYLWVPYVDAVDRQALIRAAYAEMYQDVPLPSLNMNPRPDVGSVVNLGLWLAVNDPGEVSAVAEVGPVWAVTTARVSGMSWDMGNGDVVDCDGLGVPYPEGSNQLEQGPCGYTYTEQPPIDGYTVTATGRWGVQLTTSDGANQSLEPIAMATAFPYDVDELVTGGVG